MLHGMFHVNRFFQPIIQAGAMTFNFWFLSGGRNPAATIQAIQRATGPSDARPRAPLPLADRVEGYSDAIPQIVNYWGSRFTTFLKNDLQGNGFHFSSRFYKECGTHPSKRKCSPYFQDFQFHGHQDQVPVGHNDRFQHFHSILYQGRAP